MKIFPAIDIKDKKCVRLVKGDFDKKTEYKMSPVDQASKYKDHGFKNLHIVDLDGALTGETVNLDIIKQIVTKFDLKIEVGGGIRTIDSINGLSEQLHLLGYHHRYWEHCTWNKGYAGVGIISKFAPLSVEYGLGQPELDSEGRTLTAEFANFILLVSYVPVSGKEFENQHKRELYELSVEKQWFSQSFLRACYFNLIPQFVICSKYIFPEWIGVACT